MGSGNTDHNSQINTALSQANLPKSPLAQQYSNLFGAASPGLMDALMNIQSLGNSYINSNGATGSSSGGAPPPGAGSFSPMGPANDVGGGSSPFGTTGGGGGSGVNLGQNGLPNGVNIPGFIGANPNLGGMNGANNNAQDLFRSIFGMAGGGGALGQAASGDQYNLGGNTTDLMGSINSLLSRVGNNTPQVNFQNPTLNGIQNVQPSSVNAQNVNNPGFNQQFISPGQVNFNPQQANAGQVSTNFNPVTADLSTIPNSTQLTPSTSQGFDAISQILNQQNTKNIADIREQSLQSGQSNSSGEDYATSTYRAQEAPQLASALENVRNQEVSNQLSQASLQQQGALANTGFQNQFGLGGATLGANTGLANVQNQLSAIAQNNQAGLGAANVGLQNVGNTINAANLNNLTGLQARGQDVSTALANASNNLTGQQSNQTAGIQAGGINNTAISSLNNLLSQIAGQNLSGQESNQAASLTGQGQNYGLLNNLLGTQLGQSGQGLQDFFQSISALQNQQGLATGAANTAITGQNDLSGLLAQLSQFNAGQGNAYNLGIGGMNQQTAQGNLNNQLQMLQMLFQGGLGMASQGIPGGSANVNVTNANPQGGGVGGTLGGIGSILSGLAGFR